MNLRDLKYFIAVAKYQHFGKAAKACFVSQPTLSYQLKKLEEYLGVTLFDRDNQSVVITSIGKKILEKAENAIFETEQIIDLAELSKNPLHGEVRVGVIPTIAPYLLPRIITKIRNKYPDLKLLIREDTTDNLLNKLKDNSIDVMIQAFPMDVGDFKTDIFYRDEFLIAVPKDHEWADLKSIDKDALQGKNLLLLEEEHCLSGHILGQLCDVNKSKTEYDFRATSLETLRHMVIGGVGITVIPELAIHQHTEVIKYIPFKDPKPYRDIGLVWREGSSRESLMQEIAAYLREIL